MESNPDLEALILEDPSRMDPWLVYADWLIERGDPRGHLMAASATGRSAQGLLVRHHERLLGPFAAGRELARWVDLDWQPGFWREARVVGSRRAGRSGHPSTAHVLRVLLAHPSARLLQSLWVQDIEDSTTWQATVDALITAGRGLPLRSLRLGDFDENVPMRFAEDHWEQVMAHGAFLPMAEPDREANLDVSCLWSAFPRLEHLEMSGLCVVLGRIEASRLRSLILRTAALPLEAALAIGQAHVPSLENIEVWFGTSEVGPDHLAPLLCGRALLGLRWLGLVATSFTDEIPDMLARSPLLPGLRGLDLSKGRLLDECARELIAREEHFRHLEEIAFSPGELDGTWQNALEEALPTTRFFRSRDRHRATPGLDRRP